MANTNFIDDTGVDDGTPFIAAWFQDINNVCYDILGNGVSVPPTQEQLRSNIGVEIGSDVQAWDIELDALSSLFSAADKGIQFTGAGTAATYDLTTAGKALLDDADAAAQRVTMGVEIDVDVQSALDTSSIDRMYYVSAPGVISISQISMAGRNLLGDVGFAAMRVTLGVEIGVDVQAWDTQLDTLSTFGVLDENDMVSDSATDLATQQSIKAYVDSNTIRTDLIVFGYPTTYSDTFTTNFGADINQLDITSAPQQLFVTGKTSWRLTTTGTLPAPLALNTDYYIVAVNTATGIEVALTPNGAPVVLTDNGTGVHTFAPLASYVKKSTLISSKITNIAGGGSGSGCLPLNSAGEGGGAGGCAIRHMLNSELLSTETIVVGFGGLGTTGDGNPGAASSFGAHISATAGINGQGGLQNVDSGTGGAGGDGQNGDINLTGGGGIAVMASGDGGDPKAGGSGGNSLFGGGGSGGFAGSGTSTATDGLAATAYGSGGGGGAVDGGANAIGGNAYGGCIIIEEQYTVS